jgi:succinyl-diaminopimelate desuccinylase
VVFVDFAHNHHFSRQLASLLPNENVPVRVTLARAAERHLDKRVPAEVAGPSNIGNYLAKLGIDATAGFGVRYKALHGANERIELATIPMIQAIYHEAVLKLLSP